MKKRNQFQCQSCHKPFRLRPNADVEAIRCDCGGALEHVTPGGTRVGRIVGFVGWGVVGALFVMVGVAFSHLQWKFLPIYGAIGFLIGGLGGERALDLITGGPNRR